MFSHSNLYNTPFFENINKFFDFSFSIYFSGRTYINKRLLKLDVKSVIRKGNDGILSTAHIFSAFSMKFKERNLQNERRNPSEF